MADTLTHPIHDAACTVGLASRVSTNLRSLEPLERGNGSPARRVISTASLIRSNAPKSSRNIECATVFLSSLTKAALAHFNSMGEQHKHAAGSVIFKEGDSADGIFLVCSGKVKLFAKSRDGHTMIVKIAPAGDLLGLSATLNDMPYEVAAETMEPCELRYIDERLLVAFLERYPEAAYAAALALAREHREVFLIARRLALTPSAHARISQILLEFANSSKGLNKSCQCFPMALTHAELASMAGTSRETVTRLLNEFERDGIISRKNATMTILRSVQLTHLAD